MTNTNEIQNTEIDVKQAEHILKYRDEIIEQLWNAQKSLRTLTSIAIQIENDYVTGYDLISLIELCSQRIRNIEGVFEGKELEEEVKIFA